MTLTRSLARPQDFNMALKEGASCSSSLLSPSSARRRVDALPSTSSVTLAAQAEPTATGEYVDLTDQVRASKSAQFQAEHDLRAYRRSVQSDLEAKVRVEEENAQLRELCRRHGLLV